MTGQKKAKWEVEYTDEFEDWWGDLTTAEQEDIAAMIGVLEEKGPALLRPHVGPIVSSKHANMKELIIQHKGRPYRVLFAFDPRRAAILLVGGDKRVTTYGTRDLFQLPMNFTTII